MPYTEDSLGRGEYVVYATGRHVIVLFVPLLIAGFALLASIGALAYDNYGVAFTAFFSSVAIVVLAVQMRRSAQFTLTNKRVVRKEGWVSRRTTEVFLPKIEGVSVEQGVIGRILGYGVVLLRGTGGSYEVFRNVDAPLEFRGRIQDQIDRNDQQKHTAHAYTQVEAAPQRQLYGEAVNNERHLRRGGWEG